MDIRIAEEGARFMWPHAKRGIASVSGPGVLARLIPENIAFEYMFTGKVMGSEEALRWGLVNRVVPDGTALSEATALAKELRSLAPLSMRAMKEARVRTTNMRVEDAYVVAKDRIRMLDDSEDKREGLLAFKEKRDPVWQGR
jgi:enoyl-CoA hydratase/carnithine racemase